MTCFADTKLVSIGSAASTGVNESFALVRTSESPYDSGDVGSGQPIPICSRSWKMLYNAFVPLSVLNSYDGHEYSRTHDGLSVLTPHNAHSLVVLEGNRDEVRFLTRRNISHEAPPRFGSCRRVRPTPSCPSPQLLQNRAHGRSAFLSIFLAYPDSSHFTTTSFASVCVVHRAPKAP
jgi:hypothetical protein